MPCGDNRSVKEKCSTRKHKNKALKIIQRFFIVKYDQELFFTPNGSLLYSFFKFFTLEYSLDHDSRNMNLVGI